MKKWFLFLVGFPSTAVVLKNPKVGSINGDSRELKLELKDKSDLIKESRRGQGAAGREVGEHGWTVWRSSLGLAPEGQGSDCGQRHSRRRTSSHLAVSHNALGGLCSDQPISILSGEA